MTEPTTAAGRALLIDLVEHVEALAPKESKPMHDATAKAVLAIEAEAATLVLDVGKVTAALNAAWIDSNDAVGMALPPDLAAHLLARLDPNR